MTFIKLNNNLISLGGKLLSVPSILPTPQVIYDSNTVAWYKSDDLSTITKDSSDFVSRWNDKLGSGHDLIQNTGVSQPKWFNNEGVLFDGFDFMKTDAFTYVQPEFIYIVFNQITWAGNWSFIFDGNTEYSGGFTQQYNNSHYLALYNGAYPTTYAVNGNLPLNVFGIARVLFNGANSKIQINNTISTTGNFGTIKNMNGFYLGRSPNHSGYFSNIQVKEIIARKVADNTTDETNIYNYLKAKYNL